MYKLSSNETVELKNSIVILGNFDGMHKGHMKLIEKAKQLKNSDDENIVLFTFYPYPLEVIRNEKSTSLIFSNDEKLYVCDSIGVDYYFECIFDDATMHMKPKKFIETFLVGKLGAKHIVVGDDFRFAYRRSGDTSILNQFGVYFGYEVHIVEKLKIDDEIVSSTLLRQCITNAEFAKFKKLTGRDYFILGEVVHGRAIGRTLGYPTANINVNERKLSLAKGVYATKTHIDGKTYDSISFVGNSLGYEDFIRFETYIFDFSEMIYGQVIKVDIVQFIRGQKSITSLEELKTLIEEDICKVKLICG